MTVDADQVAYAGVTGQLEPLLSLAAQLQAATRFEDRRPLR